MKKTTVIVLIICTVGVAAIIAGCRHLDLESKIMDTKPLPTDVFLGEITNNTLHVTLTWPNAEPWSYHILAAMPMASTNGARHRTYLKFEGTVTVKDQTGEFIERLSISPETVQGCNWLTHSHNLDAIILTWKITNRFDKCVQGLTYDMVVSFSERPQEYESLWLHFLQSAEQSREEKSEQSVAPYRR